MLGQIAFNIFSHASIETCKIYRALEKSRTNLINTFRPGIRLNAKPEHGQDHPTDDAEVAEPESERRPVQDRECNVQSGADCAVQDHYNSYDDMPDCNGR